MTNSSENRDSSVMMSSTMPSAKYSCSGSPLRLVKGRTAIEGLSGRARAGLGGSTGPRRHPCRDGPCSSRTAPTKRKPLRGSVLISRCSSPLSPIAPRAALMRVVSAASETMRPLPDGGDQVVLADHALPVADQVVEQIEHLRRQRRSASAPRRSSRRSVSSTQSSKRYRKLFSSARSDPSEATVARRKTAKKQVAVRNL